MPRLRLRLRVALPALLACVGALLLAACTGTSDPTSASQGAAEGTYVHATLTLLDTDTPCIPGVLCDPELLNCNGTAGISLPKTWTMHADEATAGTQGWSPPGDTNLVAIVRGTDTLNGTSISVALNVTIDPATNTVVSAVVGGRAQTTFANIDSRCTNLNASLDPVTLFGHVTAEPSTGAVTDLSIAGGEVLFAEPSGSGLSARYLEGTFSFTAANQQQFGRVYVARVLVQGCFRVQLPLVEREVPLDPAVTTGC